MEIRTFSNEIDKFLNNLENTTRSKVSIVLDLLEEYSYELKMPFSKPLSDGLFELRIISKTSVRIIYCFYKGYIILLHAFIKKRNEIRPKDLNLARKRQKSLA